ncbi:hypothetical protein CY35_10G089600 [Sphagnum magellanicum]|nr:hypothetical protein CY35_10G089600 [Sphagnum magellanicum]
MAMANFGYKKVLMLVGDYVEDCEAMVTFQALQAFGLTVDAVCPGKSAGEICVTAVHDFKGHQTYYETQGHNFKLTATYADVNADSYDALVIPGGRAPEYLSADESVLHLVKKFVDSKRLVASICHGPLVLAAADVLKGLECTGFAPVKPVVIAAGGIWKEDPCVQDGNLVTAAAWPDNPEFLKLIIKALGGKIHGSGKKILMLCGDFMEDYEALVPFQAMKALGYQVDAVCPDKRTGDKCSTAVHDFEGAQTYSEKPGHDFTLTASFNEVEAESYDALVIPGGRSPEYLALNEKVLSIAHHFAETQKPIASICHGQQILAAAGVLKAKTCTAYPALKKHIMLFGANWEDPNPITKCFTDGNLVTGAAWPAHPEFIANFMALLGSSVKF